MEALTGHTFGTHAGMSALTKAARLLAGIRVAEGMVGMEVDDAGYLPCPTCGVPFNVRNGGQIDDVKGGKGHAYVGGSFVLICAGCNQHRAGLQAMGGDFAGIANYAADVARASVGVPYVGGTVARRLLATYPPQDEATNHGNVGRRHDGAFEAYRAA